MSPVCSAGLANFQNLMVRTQNTLPQRSSAFTGCASRTYLPQTGSYDVLIYPWHLSILHTVMFHPCCRHDNQTTAAASHHLDVPPIRLIQSASGRLRFLVPPFATTCLSTSHLHRDSLFSNNDSRPYFSPFLPRHYHMTHVLLSPFITTVFTPVVLELINII